MRPDTMLIYYAHPIDMAYSDPDAVHTLDNIGKLHDRLRRPGRHIYRPGTAWSCSPDHPDPRIEQTNRTALEHADLLVAALPPGMPSYGVPMEIEAAAARGVPVVVWGGTRSFALAGHPEVETYGSYTETADRVDWLHKTWIEDGYLGDRPPTPDQTRRISFVLGDQTWPAPTRGYPDDAGWDLYTADNYRIDPGEYLEIQTTVTGLQLPPDMWGMVTGRSSATRRGLMVQMAVIDTGWRGHLAVWVYNASKTTQDILFRDRIGQLIPIPMYPTNALVLPPRTALDPHPRGQNGFGSTGQ